MPNEDQRRAIATAQAWNQGAIRGLDDAMTRRLVASTVLTESSGGDLDVTNRQGYVGRYQAGAGWLADAGYVDAGRMRAAMQRDGFEREWDWAVSGGMTRFLRDSDNWRDGLSLDRYKASADLQDRAFKINCDAAVATAVRQGRLDESADDRTIAGFLKARHISGLGGAYDALRGRAGPADINGTNNLTYFNHIVLDRDGLDALMQTSGRMAPVPAAPDPLADGILRHGERGEAVRQLQARLNAHGMQGLDGKPLPLTGNYLDHTQAAVREFQRRRDLPATGQADAATRAALARAPEQAVTSPGTRGTGDGRVDFDEIMRRMLPPQGGKAPHVTSPFGAERGAVDHGGVDFNYVGGQSGVNLRHPTVHAPVSGTVVFAGGQYGTVKIRDAAGNTHEILHLQTQAVREGQPIEAGAPIGTMGGRGPRGESQYAQHVHYQLRDSTGRVIDPAAFWNGARGQALDSAGAPTSPRGALADGELRFGEQGGPVRDLQARLNAFGIRDEHGRVLPLTGNYRERTQAAVAEFQRTHGLPETGVADRATLAALARSPDIKRGHEGAAVAHVQQMLNRAGIEVPVTGRFTYQTEGAVKDFQVANGLEPSGVVSGETLHRLRRAAETARQHEAAAPADARDGEPPLLAQARGFVRGLDAERGRTPDARSDNLSGALAASAAAHGLSQIDVVVLSEDGTRAFAVQGQGEARRIAPVEIAQAIATPVERSVERIASVPEPAAPQPAAQPGLGRVA